MYSEDDTIPSFEGGPGRRLSAKRWYQRWWGRLIIVFLAIFLSLLTAVVFYVSHLVILLRSGNVTPERLFVQTAASRQADPLPNLATSDDPFLGRRDAKIVIVEFADFTCPACIKEHQVIKELIRGYGDKVLYVLRDFPVINDRSQAGNAALAAACAQEQGKFWEMADWLYANADKIDEQNLAKQAFTLGLEVNQFALCMSTIKYGQEIEDDYEAGYLAGVRVTPTFFINGYKIPGAIPLANFETLITTELSNY